MPASATALVVIDMQEGMRSDRLPPRNNPDAEDRIAALLAAWRAAGWPVVLVRHISRSPDSVFAPGQPGPGSRRASCRWRRNTWWKRTCRMPSPTPAWNAGCMRAACAAS